MNAVSLTPGNQGLEDLLLGHTDGIGGVGTLQIVIIKFIKGFPAGNLCLLNQPNCVCFCCQIDHRLYYTTACQVAQGKKGWTYENNWGMI